MQLLLKLMIIKLLLKYKGLNLKENNTFYTYSIHFK